MGDQFHIQLKEARGVRRALLAVSAASFLVLGAPAMAQTALTPVQGDPTINRLSDRIDDLEGQVRSQTGQVEKLQYELGKAQADINRLSKLLDDVLAEKAGSAVGGASVGGVPGGVGGAPLGAAAAAPTPSAQGKLGDLSVSALPSQPGEAYRQAFGKMQRGDYPGAEQAFTAYLTRFPDADNAAEAHYWLGQTLLVRGAPTEAAKQFLVILQKFPTSSKAPDAQVRLGVSLRGMGQKQQACAAFRDLPRRYPQASAMTKTKATQEAKSMQCA